MMIRVLSHRMVRYCLILLLGLLASPVFSQEGSVTLDQVYDIAGRLYCPVCPTETLDTCRTVACARWREEIRVQLAAGRAEAQIVEDFVARYGERVLSTPQDPVLHALSVAAPFVAAGLAVLAGLYTLRRWSVGRRPALAETPMLSQGPTDDTYLTRLEQDVNK